MSATYAGVTPSLPSCNPNASRTDERPVQLTRMDRHVDNPDFASKIFEIFVLVLLESLTFDMLLFNEEVLEFTFFLAYLYLNLHLDCNLFLNAS